MHQATRRSTLLSLAAVAGASALPWRAKAALPADIDALCERARSTFEVPGISVCIADLDGLTLGFAEDRVIVLDRDAAGWGWSLDPRAAVSAGRIDLLTVLVHELGHVLGLTHADSGLMFEALAPGVRLSAPRLARAMHLVRGCRAVHRQACNQRPARIG